VICPINSIKSRWNRIH